MPMTSILIMDKDGKIIEANDSAVDSYGYSRDELFGLHLGDLFADGRQGVTEPEQMAAEARNGLRV